MRSCGPRSVSLGSASRGSASGWGSPAIFRPRSRRRGSGFRGRERAFATGIFNAGANLGAILAPLLIPLFVLPDGTHWQYAFLVTGVFSLCWVITWLKTYRPPESEPRLSAAELAYIRSDSPPTRAGARIPWRKVLPLRETWAFSLAKLTDGVWWFYLFWGGKFLYDRFGLDIKGLALPLITIYVVSDVGSVAGGWLSSTLIKRGWTVNRARKTAMLASALCVLPVAFVTLVPTRFNVDGAFFGRLGTAAVAVPESASARLHSLEGRSYGSAKEFTAAAASVLGRDEERRLEGSLIGGARSDNLYWVAVLLIAAAAAGHQGWSANLFTIVSDVLPKAATASVIGIGGMFGAVAGLVGDWSLGRVLSSSGPSGYLFAFLVAGSAYLFFLGVVQLLMPRMTPLNENLEHVISYES